MPEGNIAKFKTLKESCGRNMVIWYLICLRFVIVFHECLKYFIMRKKILVADYKIQNETNISINHLKFQLYRHTLKMCSVPMSLELKRFHNFSLFTPRASQYSGPSVTCRWLVPGSLPRFGCPKSMDAQVLYIKWHSFCI